MTLQMTGFCSSARFSMIALLLGSLALAACKRIEHPSMPPIPEPKTEPPATVVAAHDNLNAVVWMQQSAEYAGVTRSLYQAASAQLDTALARKDWDALSPAERGEIQPDALAALAPAVIVDIDETVLDNSAYQARLVADDAEFNTRSWDLWVAEKKATAVPGALEFAQAAAERGITVLYISNRAVHLKQATVANLQALGFPLADESAFLGMGQEVQGCSQAKPSDKQCRRQFAGQNYRILMQFGDQLGDFVEIPTNTPQARATLLAEHGNWLGQRWWVLPNPSYGNWESALFGDDWTQPVEIRRQAKRAALNRQL